MILRADFGWVILVAFVFWVLQLVRAGARGRGGRGRPLPPSSSPGQPGGTQREGAELEQFLRYLERRLGGESAPKPSQAPAPVTVKRPAAPVRAKSPREADRNPVTVVSLENPVDRAAEAEALDRQRVAVATERNRELTDADHAVFTAKIRAGNELAARSPAAPAGLTVRQLRDAVVWQEILGSPRGLQ